MGFSTFEIVTLVGRPATKWIVTAIALCSRLIDRISRRPEEKKLTKFYGLQSKGHTKGPPWHAAPECFPLALSGQAKKKEIRCSRLFGMSLVTTCFLPCAPLMTLVVVVRRKYRLTFPPLSLACFLSFPPPVFSLATPDRSTCCGCQPTSQGSHDRLNARCAS
jgi:hypothetical protein